MTEYMGTYWSEKGKYQEEYDLIQTLIPTEEVSGIIILSLSILTSSMVSINVS